MRDCPSHIQNCPPSPTCPGMAPVLSNLTEWEVGETELGRGELCAPLEWPLVLVLQGNHKLGHLVRTPGFSARLWEGNEIYWVEWWGWESALLGSSLNSGRGAGSSG